MNNGAFTVQTIKKLERKILFSETKSNFLKTKINFLETKILFLVTASKFLETKNLFAVTKLFEYATNILICNDRNVYVCVHYANYIKMNLIKTSSVQKICFVSKNKIFLSNFLIVCTVIDRFLFIKFSSGLNSEANHHSDLNKSMRILSYYTMMRDDKTRRSTDAKKILHLRIKPSIREFHSQNSIESMVYVDIDQYPTIWCAIGNKIKIYDAITWHDEVNDLKINEKIVLILIFTQL